MGKRKKEFKTYVEEKSILSPERINELKEKVYSNEYKLWYLKH